MAARLLLPCLSSIWLVVVVVVVGEYISLSSMAIGTIILHNGGFVVLGNHGRHPLSFSGALNEEGILNQNWLRG